MGIVEKHLNFGYTVILKLEITVLSDSCLVDQLSMLSL